MEINILLGKVAPKQLGASVDYYKVVHGAYTSQYLQALGIEPLERHRKVVARRAPLQKCVIEATWADGAVADQLRIVPEQVQQRSKASSEAAFGKDAPMDPMIWALPPETSGIYERAKKGAAQTTRQEERYAEAFSQMRTRDQKNSKEPNSDLTRELEELHRKAKGEEGPVHRREALRLWGKEGHAELQDLKRKFILPFACESPNGMSIWSELPTLDWGALRPPSVTLERLGEEASDYAENFFPLELLSMRRDPLFFDDLRQCLQSAELSRLIGLAAHLIYWNALGHLHPEQLRLPSDTRQSLIFTIQELWSKLTNAAGLGKADGPARGFAVPVFLLFLKWGIERVFRLQYRILEDPDRGADAERKLVTHINVTVMTLFDPDCAAANFGCLDTSSEAIRLWRKLHVNQMKIGLTPATRTIAREFRTSPMMLMRLQSDGGPSDPKTRKLLLKSSSDSALRLGMPEAGRGSPSRQAASMMLRPGKVSPT